MPFLQIYLPILAALLSAFVITEAFHLALSYYMHRKAQRDFEAKVARGEIDPMTMMFGGAGMPGMPAMGPPPLPTVSGKVNETGPSGYGQYL